MFDSLTSRFSRVIKNLRGEARLTSQHTGSHARGAHGAAGSGRRAARRQGFRRARARERAGPGSRGQPHAGAGGGRRGLQRAGQADGREERRAEPRRSAAGRRPSRGTPGLGQDHHRRQARALVEARAQEEGAPRELRRLPPGGDRAARDAGETVGGRVLPLRGRREAGRYRAPRARARAHALRRRADRGQRGAARHRRADDAR